MMDYETMRHFADSWGLVYMVAIFLAAVLYVLRPRGRDAAREAALIPFRDETGKDKTP